jgi:hypothetical protein
MIGIDTAMLAITSYLKIPLGLRGNVVDQCYTKYLLGGGRWYRKWFDFACECGYVLVPGRGPPPSVRALRRQPWEPEGTAAIFQTPSQFNLI